MQCVGGHMLFSMPIASFLYWHIVRIGRKNAISLELRARKDALWHMLSLMGTRNTWELHN
jgi:hypothetical protein